MLGSAAGAAGINRRRIQEGFTSAQVRCSRVLLAAAGSRRHLVGVGSGDADDGAGAATCGASGGGHIPPLDDFLFDEGPDGHAGRL